MNVALGVFDPNPGMWSPLVTVELRLESATTMYAAYNDEELSDPSFPQSFIIDI